MKKIAAYIDRLKNNILSGWVATEKPEEVNIYCNKELVGHLTLLTHRQDVINAGHTDGNSGFSIDLDEYLDDKCGDFEFSLEVDGTIIATKILNILNGANYIKNPFFVLETKSKFQDIDILLNHRIGNVLHRFNAPLKLLPTINAYSRLSFGDTNNSREFIEIEPKLNLVPSIFITSAPLELQLVAKTSHVANLHIRLVNNQGQCIFDEPIPLNINWEQSKLSFSSEISDDLRQGNLKLCLRTKHHGRRFFDIALLCISESTDKFIENLTTNTDITGKSTNLSTKMVNELNNINLLQNGELTSWKNGVNFGQVDRGQELADNWFIEMSQQNKTNIFASMNNIESPLPPYESEFGLKMRTAELNGYARIISPFSTELLHVVDYELKLDISAKQINDRFILPRLFLIARDTKVDKQIFVIERKIVVNGRQKLSFNITAKDIETLITNANGLAVITLALDLPSSSEFTLFSCKLSEAPFDMPAKSDEDNIEVESLLANENSLLKSEVKLAFEDDSITEQLALLKGLENWDLNYIQEASGDDFSSTDTDQVNPSLGGFTEHIFNLIPHKLNRPSRNFPFIDVIVPVYNACDDVLLCLSALIEKTDLIHRVIVINDGQEERTAEMLKAFDAKYNHLEVITNEKNIGYTKSVNKGVSYSNADWVVVLNSDTIVSEGWLGRLMNCALSDEKVGMVGALSNAASWQSVPQIYDAEGDWNLNPIPKGMTVDDMAREISDISTREYPSVGVINGFCQLINMQMLDVIGVLDEIAFPVGYGEENDMCARAVKAGYKLLIADDTYVYHAKSKSFGHEKRKVLAKQGSAALKKKHPDVNWGEITKVIFHNPALVSMRNELTERLKVQESK